MKDVSVVFLDRDGTINVDVGHLRMPSELVLIRGAATAISLLKKAGYVLLVVSNQSAVARGMCSEEDVKVVNQTLLNMLLREHPEARLDDFFFCPHHPEDNCNCRKPRTGMAEQARTKWNFISHNCWVIGDKLSDLEFGKAIGIPTKQRILLETGHGASQYERRVELSSSANPQEALHIIYKKDLLDAVKFLLTQKRNVR